jgi:transcriptional regulator with XRE-family HTH domain
MTTPAGAQERALAVAFAARVRALRQQKNISQRALARAAGLSVSWLGRVESSPRSITLALIDRLRRALDVSYDELLGDLPPITERYSRANRTRYVHTEDD